MALLMLAIFAWFKPVSAQQSGKTSAALRYELWGAVTGATSGPAYELATSNSPPQTDQVRTASFLSASISPLLMRFRLDEDKDSR